MQALLNASEEIRICPETRFMDKVMKPYYRYPAGVRKRQCSRVSAALELKWKLSRYPWKREVVAMLVAESAARSGEANDCTG